MKAIYHDRLGEGDCLTAQSESHELWGGDFSLEIRWDRLHHFMTDFPETPMWMSGLTLNDRLVSSCKRYHFDLLIQGIPQKCIGLGAVFSGPEYRRQGFAATLIQQVLSEERRLGTEWALLYSAIDLAYYVALGFHPLSSERWSVGVIDLPNLSGMTSRKARDDEWPKLRQLFLNSLPSDVIYVVREGPEDLLASVNRSEGNVLVQSGDTILGYVNYVVNGPKLFLQDYAVSARNAGGLWSAVRNLAAEAGATEVAGWAGQMPPPEASRREPRPKSWPMLAGLSPEAKSWIRSGGLAQPQHLAPIDYF